MKIRDEADAILAAGKLGLNVGTVCSAFGIDHNVHGEFGELLADAIARKDVKAMREVYQNSPNRSLVEAKALEAILAWCEESLADAIARKDVKAMREVHGNSPDGSPVEAKAIKALVETL